MKRFIYELATSVGQVGVLLAGAVILRVAFDAPPDAGGGVVVTAMAALGVVLIVLAALTKAGFKNV